ncbi:hypothetical protein [Cryobacterium sp. M25]|nr:hypothetical protein [Cryobacterium sp. M25]
MSARSPVYSGWPATGTGRSDVANSGELTDAAIRAPDSRGAQPPASVFS